MNKGFVKVGILAVVFKEDSLDYDPKKSKAICNAIKKDLKGSIKIKDAVVGTVNGNNWHLDFFANYVDIPVIYTVATAEGATSIHIQGGLN